MKNSTHSWDDPCDEMSFEELVENCDKYDDPFDYAIFCNEGNFLSGRFYVYNLNWDVYPTEDEEAELLKELHEYGYNELIQLLDMDEFQDIVHEQRNKKADSTIEDYWTALQIATMDKIIERTNRPDIISTEMNEFINKIENIFTQLSEVEGKYDFSLADKYQGNIFPTQMELAVKMENLVHQITHEICSTIAFLKEDIIELHRYIEFRRKYAILSECELLFLIDDIGGNLNIKKCINDKTNAANWLNIRQTVLEDWKSNFGDVSFEKINSKFNVLITRTSIAQKGD